MGKKLYVGNLSYNVDQGVLERLFAEHGSVESATVIHDRDSGQSKGFGFVEMSSNGEAEGAIAALHGKEHDGRTLTVSEARARTDQPRGASNFGANRNGTNWR
jgi:cold-inducible RNA-binding protein